MIGHLASLPGERREKDWLGGRLALPVCFWS